MKANSGSAKLIKQAVFYAALVFLWQLVAALGVWPGYVFPSPLNVMRAVAEGVMDGSFLIGIVVSFRRLLIGFFIAMLLGGLLGVILRVSKSLDETIGSLVLGLQTLPSICWLPLALLWFGLSEWAIIFVVVAGSLFSITMATNSAFKHTPPLYINVGRNMGARGVVLLWRVVVPAALPSLLMGLRQSWSFAWRSLMAGELLFNCLGLGFLLNMGRELNDMNRVVAVMFIIMIVSIFIDRLIFGKIESGIKRRYGL